MRLYWLPAACLLVGLATVALQSTSQPTVQTRQIATLDLTHHREPRAVQLPDIAQLATIEPAEGTSDTTAAETPVENEGEAKDVTSYSGKNLTGKPGLPLVTIDGQPVVTAKDLILSEQTQDLGKLAQNPESNDLLNRPWHVVPFAHNPVRGSEMPKVTLIEFSDLSCVQCMPYLAKEDEWVLQHQGDVRQTQIYAPVTQFADTNLAAFYSKVAQRGGTFWKYRDALIKLQDPSPEKYFATLLNTGVDRATVRRVLNTEARRLYRELDSDAGLAHRISLGNPPAFVIGTIMVGDRGVSRDSLQSVLTYQLNHTNRMMALKPSDTDTRTDKNDE